MPQVRCFLGTLIDAVAANAAAGSRTATIDLGKLHTASGAQRTPVLFRGTIVLARVAATNVSVQFSLSIDGGTTYGRQQVINMAAGTGILSDYTPTKTGSTDHSFDLQLDVRCATHLRVVVAAAAGGSTDYLSLLGAVLQEV